MDLAGQAAEDGRRVAAAAAHLEHAVGGVQVERSGHGGDDQRLRGGLALGEGEGLVLAGALGGLGIDEGRAIDVGHRGQDPRVANAPHAQRAQQVAARGGPQPEALRRRRSARSVTLRSEARPPDSRTNR